MVGGDGGLWFKEGDVVAWCGEWWDGEPRDW